MRIMSDQASSAGMGRINYLERDGKKKEKTTNSKNSFRREG